MISYPIILAVVIAEKLCIRKWYYSSTVAFTLSINQSHNNSTVEV